MKYLVLLTLVIVSQGCNFSIRIDDTEIPKDPVKLQELVAEMEANLQGLEEELVEAKNSRDFIAKAAENAEGFFAQSDYASKLSGANRRVEFAAREVTWERSSLAKIKALLDSANAKPDEPESPLPE